MKRGILKWHSVSANRNRPKTELSGSPRSLHDTDLLCMLEVCHSLITMFVKGISFLYVITVFVLGGQTDDCLFFCTYFYEQLKFHAQLS